ncbi:hypothetical protein F511_30256 [Dorcoceras hygrometricum]|uniref:Uncharacterized protein n=1 Tax=Dorcoceras hygrometricum TaxID=472368 RepID=A0A2Z7CDI1_9LAMI|nr:hypothetical protein F511_30256 [Dorcoceras hygrometricum]
MSREFTCSALLPRACDGHLGSRGVPARGVFARVDGHLGSRGILTRADGHLGARDVPARGVPIRCVPARGAEVFLEEPIVTSGQNVFLQEVSLQEMFLQELMVTSGQQEGSIRRFDGYNFCKHPIA